MHRRDRDLARIARHRLTALTTPRAPAGPDHRPAPDDAGDGGLLAPPASVGLDHRPAPDYAGDGAATDLRPPAGVPATTRRVAAHPVRWSAPDVAGWVPPLGPAPEPGGAAVLPSAGIPERLEVGGGQPVPPPTHAQATLTTAALQVAAAGYTATHGHPAARAHAARRRVRWAISWRLAAAAGTVVLLVAGAVALRAAALAPGPAVALPTPAPSVPEASASPTGTADVVVDVVGAVATPGVVRLPQGSRVVDALAAAGGAGADAEVSALNLARVLVDGEQIVVPRPGERAAQPGAAGPAGEGDDLVDLNTADATVLDSLPGIGPVLAERIVAHREDGPFTTVDELADVAGIGPTLLERLRDLVRV
ncbi:ComEA family DNA-binding protein [Cellulomonas xylanilytica]|uniref:Helix-hairpin-helix DNA-binding motif class 1 domain-containing protein n=1 Tax=Cellulomonas xylanilytica TaxID=233583 RepID=A0A510UXU4_9CELL|nr:ComEA family DNA-binding protein [Cellulomonas xylanilytica]GEK19502.1 hypothetical protein CXY01_00220 [Cellulomonas xylanilytica]